MFAAVSDPWFDEIERFALDTDLLQDFKLRHLPPLAPGEELAPETQIAVDRLLLEYTKRGQEVITLLWGLDGRGARSVSEVARSVKKHTPWMVERVSEDAWKKLDDLLLKRP